MAKTKKKFKNTKVGGILNKIGGIFKVPDSKKLNLGANAGGSLQKQGPTPQIGQNSVVKNVGSTIAGQVKGVKNSNVPAPISSSKFIGPVKPQSKANSSGVSSGVQYGPFQPAYEGPSINTKTGASTYNGSGNSGLLENGSDALNNPATFEAQPSYQPTQTITNRDVTSTTPNLPNSNVIGGNADFYNQYLEPIVPLSEQKVLDEEKTTFDTMLEKYLDVQDEGDNREKTYKDLEEEMQIEEKKRKADEVANRINTINAQAEANQLSLIGQGRGIPEAIIGGQSAQIAREAAIRVLPLSAEYAAAKGDFEYAQDRLDKMYQIRVADIDARTATQTKIIEWSKQFADKDTARKLDKIDEQNRFRQEDQKQLEKYQWEFMGDALKNGQTSLASKFKLLDVNSKTFRQDLLNLRSQLREPAKASGGGSGIGTNSYIVKVGDTGRNIAASLGLTWETLNALNPGVNWDKLRPNQKLNINTGDLPTPKEDNGLTDVQLRQEIRQVISTDEFKQLTKSQKEDYILSQGGDPLDYEY